uniref:Uncharacterized protein n=1 Tax=Rhizophora mucronata TaxID=61149 RepID=A0A2P2JVQ5_RHIMU
MILKGQRSSSPFRKQLTLVLFLLLFLL